MFVAVNVDKLVEQQMPVDHPLRRIRSFTNLVLASLSAQFDALYATGGRPSIPPECMLRALLWQAMFSIRSERQLEETIRYDLRCRWFVDVPLDQDAWDHSTFTKARGSLLLQEISVLFFERHVEFLRAEGLVSDEHLSVDGTLLAAWASHKSLVRKDDLDDDGRPPPAPKGGRNAWVDFKGQGRSNETHISATDPEAKLASKGTGAKLSHELNVLAENRNNLVVDFTVCPPSGTSERDDAAALVHAQCMKGHAPSTVGADRKYAEGDTLLIELERMGVIPHFAVRDDRPNSLARVYEDTPGYPVSLRCRMRIEEVFAYVKGVAGIAKLKVRGFLRVFGVAAIALAAYNLTRHATLRPA